MVEVRGLEKRYGSVVAVNGLDLAVERGDLCGLVGPNGAGKTTTLKILATLLRADAGTVRVCGYDVPADAALVRRRIGYMPDGFGVYEDMTVVEYLEFFAALYGLEPAAARRVIQDVLDLTDLRGKAECEVETLSRGVQQRLGLARLLVHDPEVLLLDEPASGLDPRARVEIRALLRELRGLGKTIVVSSHVLSDLAEICNRVAIVEHGRLVFQGEIGALLDLVRRRGRVFLRIGGELERALAALRTDPRIARAEPAPVAGGPGPATPDRGMPLRVELAEPGGGHGFLAELMVRAGALLLELREEEPDLEDAFLRVTRGEVA
jgi:ABC-2 type transport system ATP-binding protein